MNGERNITPCLSCPVANSIEAIGKVEEVADPFTRALYGLSPAYENSVVEGVCQAYFGTVPQKLDICHMYKRRRVEA